MFRIIVVLVFSACSLLGFESAPAQDATEAATRQYAVAVGFLNQKLYEQAADEWKTFIEKFPNDPRLDKAWHYLGTCNLQADKLDDAITAFSTLLRRFPKFELADASALNLGIAYYNRAQELNKTADYESAQRVFASLLKQHAQSKHAPAALFYSGECFFHTQKHADAATTYSSLIEKYPQSEFVADAQYALGVTQETLKQPDRAEATFAAFLRKFPNHALVSEVRMRQAEALFSAGKFVQAEPLFAQVAAVKDFNLADVALMRQARCLYEQDKFDKAGRIYWDVPRQFPQTEHYDASVLAGAKCFFLDGRFETARAGLERVAARDTPEAAEACHWIARCWLKEKEPAKSLAVLDDAIQKYSDSPHLPLLLLARADAIAEIPERRAEAVGMYAEFARKYPNDGQAPQAQYMAAFTSLNLADYAGAKAHGDAFLRMFRNHKLTPDVRFIGAESRLMLEEYADATQWYRQFLSESPEHASANQAHVRLALALQLQKKHSEAIAVLEPLAARLTDRSLKAEALSLAGRSYSEQGKHDKATAALKQALNVDPDGEHAEETLLSLAEAYRHLGRNADASAQVRQLLKQFPQSSHLDEAYYRLGQYDLADGRYDQAATHFARVVATWPESSFAPLAQYDLGWARLNQRDFPGTIEAMDRLIARYPESEFGSRAYYIRAMARQQSGEFGSAVADLETYLASDPKPKQNDLLDARYVLGLCQAGLQQFDKATQTYEGILSTDSRYASADKVAYELGWAYTELGNQQRAAETFGRLARDYPESPLAEECLFRIGECRYQANQFAEAAEAYAEASSKAKTTELREKSLHKLGWSYFKLEDYRRAATTYQKQLDAFPAGELAPDATFLIGECYFKEQSWRTALQWYGKPIESKSPKYQALALYRSGQCTGSLSEWSDSMDFYRQVLERFPDFEQRAEARYGLGWALQNQNKLDEAIQQYEQVTEETQTATAAQARFMIGECLFTQKQHAEAAKHFLKAAYGYGHEEWSALAFFEAARCFEVLKDVEHAKNSYRELIERFPKHAKANDAKRRLNALGASP